MARNTMEDWIPEEYGGAVITKVNATSAVMQLSRKEGMRSDTKHVPRDGGVTDAGVAKGVAYGEDESANTDVLLTARKFGKIIRIADEDIQDTQGYVAVVDSKKTAWATSHAKMFDNSCLGTTGTENGTTVMFTSAYKALRTTNSETSYTADANYNSGAVTYTLLNEALGDYEQGDCFDEASTIVIASPAFKESLRGVVDDQHRPIFVNGSDGNPSTLFGYPITWSQGAKTSAVNTPTPGGNPLLFIGNREYLIVGLRSGPESVLAPADSGAAFTTDEDLLKMRARRGFAIGDENAFSVFEKTS